MSGFRSGSVSGVKERVRASAKARAWVTVMFSVAMVAFVPSWVVFGARPSAI